MDRSGFNLSTVFGTLAKALPEKRALIWRGREWTFAEMDARVDGVAHYLASLGLGCHTERDELQGHESGQDHIGLYLRNGNQYLELVNNPDDPVTNCLGDPFRLISVAWGEGKCHSYANWDYEKTSPAQIVCLLADCEIAFGFIGA